MNVMVTGAGLVGCHVARELAQGGHRVVLYDVAPNEAYIRRVAGDLPAVRGDIRDLPALMDVMQDHQVDTVFHSAALIGSNVAEHPYTGLNVNIGGAIAVAEAGRLRGIRRLVYASTVGVYSRSQVSAATITEESPIGGAAFYPSSKVACEQVLRAYGAHYSFELAILRFAGVYGYGHYLGGSTIGKNMHGLVTSIREGGPVRIDSQHFFTNEYVYVKDVAQGVVLGCEKPLPSDTFNIGTGVISSAADLAEAVRTVRPEVQVELGESSTAPSRPNRSQPMDLARARQELGYNPRFDLAEGIEDFIEELQREG